MADVIIFGRALSIHMGYQPLLRADIFSSPPPTVTLNLPEDSPPAFWLSVGPLEEKPC